MEATKEKLVNDFKNVLGDIDILLKETAGQLGGQAGVLREKIQDSSRRVRGQIEDLEASVADRSREAARVTDDFVRDHPWEAIGAGFGIGLLVGILINRR